MQPDTVFSAAAAAERPQDKSLPLHVSAVKRLSHVVKASPGRAAAAGQY